MYFLNTYAKVGKGMKFHDVAVAINKKHNLALKVKKLSPYVPLITKASYAWLG